MVCLSPVERVEEWTGNTGLMRTATYASLNRLSTKAVRSGQLSRCGRGVTWEVTHCILTSCVLRWRQRRWYGQEAQRIQGEEYDWQSAPIIPQAVYASGGGKPHRWLVIFVGVVDSTEARPPSRASSSQLVGFNSQTS